MKVPVFVARNTRSVALALLRLYQSNDPPKFGLEKKERMAQLIDEGNYHGAISVSGFQLVPKARKAILLRFDGCQEDDAKFEGFFDTLPFIKRKEYQ